MLVPWTIYNRSDMGTYILMDMLSMFYWDTDFTGGFIPSDIQTLVWCWNERVSLSLLYKRVVNENVRTYACKVCVVDAIGTLLPHYTSRYEILNSINTKPLLKAGAIKLTCSFYACSPLKPKSFNVLNIKGITTSLYTLICYNRASKVAIFDNISHYL